MYLHHQAYTLYYHHVCILVILHAFAYSMLLRCMLKFKRLVCGCEDVTQYNYSHQMCHVLLSYRRKRFIAETTSQNCPIPAI